jgi:hypothetical protein
MHRVLIVLWTLGVTLSLIAQENTLTGPKPARVEINPRTADVEVGQQLAFTAVAIDDAGNRMQGPPSAWFATPFDLVSVDDSGKATFHGPGQVRVGALINGRQGYASITIKPQPVAKVEIQTPTGPIPVGTGISLSATTYAANGDPRTDVTLRWSSRNPAIATIDETGFVTGIAPGKTLLELDAQGAKGNVNVEVIQNPIRSLAIEPKITKVRTGDVVHFAAHATGEKGSAILSPAVRWAVSGPTATVEPDGTFVAERSGSYSITAVSGDHSAAATVTVTPRNMEREFEVIGRTPLEEFQAGEQWIVGNYAYLTSILAGRLWVYDISNPDKPLKVDSVPFDARVINDVSTTPDGKMGVITREGASNRKNGIVFLDLSEPAHPKVLSEYTETVTGGVHSAYISSHYVYLTDDATGSLRVIDFIDPKKPKEVARWQTENPSVQTITTQKGETVGGRYLHDVQVIDGFIYMGYWKDGLVILDVGNGIKGGSPENPQFVSQLRFNYGELYGSGWLAGAHSVFRYKNYVFVGDEVFPENFDLSDRARIPTKGVVHVVDASDIFHPRKVAEYEVPEAGAHNMWVDNDVMYIGYYSGGARAVDVSGELRGNLYREGREMARLWTGDPKGFRPNIPFAWGAQPHNGLIYFNDIHTGVWATRLVDPKDRGR